MRYLHHQLGGEALESRKISLAGSAQVTIVEQRPSVTKTLAIAGAIGNDAVVGLKPWDDLGDEAVDLALVAARREAVGIVDAGELGDPDFLAVSACVVLNILLNALKGVLVDVNVGDIPISSTCLQEGSEPVLAVLLAHRRRTEDGALVGKGSDKIVPLRSAGRRVGDVGGHGAVTVRLVETHHDLGSVAGSVGLEFCKALSIVGIGKAALTIAPKLLLC